MTTASTVEPATLARILNRAALHNLSLNELAILCQIEATAQSMTTLARSLGLSATSITHLADTLEERKILARHVSRTDRRKVWLLPSEQGRTLLSDITQA